MSAMASRDTLWTVLIGGSPSRPRLRFAATGGVSDRRGAARVRDGCAPRHSWWRDDSGRRQVGAAVLSWVAKCVPRRAERQRGFPGARRSARQGAIVFSGGQLQSTKPMATRLQTSDSSCGLCNCRDDEVAI